jgi:hypothetical protein
VLAANLVVAVGLAFHELPTNAMKQIALDAGRWTVDPVGRDRRRFDIVRHERGGSLARLCENAG